MWNKTQTSVNRDLNFRFRDTKYLLKSKAFGGKPTKMSELNCSIIKEEKEYFIT